ncbi:MAG TPA: HTTM domain-containing protein [Fimbriimonas sp.]
MKDLLHDLDNYWFGRANPGGFGLFRILIGALWFVNLLMLAPDWEDWFGEHGFVPTAVARRWLGPNETVLGLSIPRIDLLGGVVDPWITMPFYALVTLAALTTALGLWSRASTLVLAVGAVSLHHRNPLILHGGDTVLRICALYLAAGPSGAACSIDRLIRVWKGKEGLEPPSVSLWAQRLVAYNVALIYLTTVWIKWQGSLWRDGTATWYTARLQEFSRFPVPPFVNDPPFIYLTTYGTLAVEFCLGTLVFFRRLRSYVLLAGLLLHGYIEYSMNIPMFALAICSMYVCFYEGSEIGRWAQRAGRRLERLRTTVRLPRGAAMSAAGVAFFDSVDPLKLVTYLPGDAPRLEAASASGKPMDPSRASWTRSVGAWTFAWIPGLWRRLLQSALVTKP